LHLVSWFQRSSIYWQHHTPHTHIHIHTPHTLTPHTYTYHTHHTHSHHTHTHHTHSHHTHTHTHTPHTLTPHTHHTHTHLHTSTRDAGNIRNCLAATQCKQSWLVAQEDWMMTRCKYRHFFLNQLAWELQAHKCSAP
jgi:hypothetical protein